MQIRADLEPLGGSVHMLVDSGSCLTAARWFCCEGIDSRRLREAWQHIVNILLAGLWLDGASKKGFAHVLFAKACENWTLFTLWLIRRVKLQAEGVRKEGALLLLVWALSRAVLGEYELNLIGLLLSRSEKLTRIWATRIVSAMWIGRTLFLFWYCRCVACTISWR